MAFMQTGASPLNGKVTYYKREGALYKTTATTTHNGAPLPAVRVTSQLEIDAFNANPNAFEHYTVAVEQLATLLGQPASAVKYPPVDKQDPLDVNFTGTSAADGVKIAINGEPNVKTFVLRIGVVGHAGADMFVSGDGSFDLGKTIAGHTIAAGDVLSVTFAYFVGTYATVDAALTSLEAWEWCKPYTGHTVLATAAP